MTGGSKIGSKRNTRNKVQLKKKGSDESDEDYKVSADEVFAESEDEYCSSVADDGELEESLGEFEDEEDEWLENNVKKVAKSRDRKSILARNENGVTRTRKKVSYNEEEEEYEDDDFTIVKQSKKNRLPYKEEVDYDIEDFCDRELRISSSYSYEIDYDKKPRKKNTNVSYRETKENSDYDDSDYDYDDDDDEFTPDEEDSPVVNNKVSRARMQETHITKGRRGKRKPKFFNRTRRKKPAKEEISRKKHRSSLDNREFTDEKHPSWKKTRRRKSSINSDSDFVSSGPSDYELTISEEEREQVREASEFCKILSSSLRSSLRSSVPLNFTKEEETVPSVRKRTGRKGKEKVVEMKIEIGKQVCGICLSEEGKRTVRGILNCCSHYFCFACIMEWSKVESRCPLCKQRFATISRTSRADGGHNLRDAVISVPERDQVYQPSEEELRGYLDPYESFLCTECQQGGDDAHMLLCDLCDSPAHTYCVGLGYEVPDGNWYCHGCRPTALASQAQNPTTTEQRTSHNSSASSSPPVPRETFDLNEMYVPETQVIEPSSLPRHNIEDFQATSTTSPSYGFGAFTLFDRRRIQRQIHQFLNNRSRQLERSDISGTTLFGSQICPDVSIAPQNSVMPLMAGPQGVFRQGRLPEYGSAFVYSREGVSPRFGGLRGQNFRDQGSTSSLSHGSVGLVDNEFAGIGGGLMSHPHFQPCSGRSNTGAGATISPFQFQEATVRSRAFQGSLHPPF